VAANPRAQFGSAGFLGDFRRLGAGIGRSSHMTSFLVKVFIFSFPMIIVIHELAHVVVHPKMGNVAGFNYRILAFTDYFLHALRTHSLPDEVCCGSDYAAFGLIAPTTAWRGARKHSIRRSEILCRMVFNMERLALLC
jgi:hypothetical protein